ncbi:MULTISPECIES: multiubiquitin domain-containing protein [unclassified Mesorhizobium]|uniref:multiubiquitin domain-containing protein n=1 Tax=unclassified Mesorhizobium TaxID=325217 RepID=UPI001FEDFEA5|nr:MULTISPECIES: multiubiquitin domain-containing protein [unclassified Mesorhizobium]
MQTQENEKGKDKTVTIIVDGSPYEVPKKDTITYAEVVTLAYPDYPQHPRSPTR